MGVKRNWKGKQAIQRMGWTSSENLKRAAIHVQNKTKENLVQKDVQGDEGRSFAGEFPAKETGHLSRSITYEMNAAGDKAYVGTPIEYGKFLELGTVNMAARPFLRKTLKEEQDEIKQIMRRKPKN